ncbi:hypothetical protein [Mycolicibacterium porcinum]|uniref:Uncharacterized protein n=1 Tax=Mycolicibacterium porcinum TaxID=39693 RepID=A0ABV3VI39_9MYCO
MKPPRPPWPAEPRPRHCSPTPPATPKPPAALRALAIAIADIVIPKGPVTR